jgi:hypothetical protein
MLVGLLTESQRNLLYGQQFDSDHFFNPIQDGDDNWIITLDEIDWCVNDNFSWVKNLELIEYVPVNNINIHEV